MSAICACVGLLGGTSMLAAPGIALAAHFTVEPPVKSGSGAGPFDWSFESDSSGLYGGLAYKLSIETSWHRCTGERSVQLTDLPDGTYTVLIADDIDLGYAAAEGLLSSGIAAPCHDETGPEPQTPITASTLEVSSAPAPVPPPRPSGSPDSTGSSATPPAPASSDRCLAAQTAFHIAEHKLRKLHRSARMRAAALRKAARLVDRSCRGPDLGHTRVPPHK